MKHNLPERGSLVGEIILEDWELTEQIGYGNIGVVYKAVQSVEGGAEFQAACKLIPEENLLDGWEAEIRKGAKLDEHDNVVSLKESGRDEVDSRQYVCIVSEFVDGLHLLDYIDKNEGNITLETIESIVGEILDVLHAMDKLGISHGDLHAKNVLLSLSSLSLDSRPTVKVTDFGVGGSVSNMDPKDDYVMLADIIKNLLESVEKRQLSSSDRYFYNYLAEEFVPKYVLESDPTKANYVRNPEKLAKLLEEGRSRARKELEEKRDISLENPFDYLSCEQMGDSYGLIEKLYSNNFPGYSRIQNRTNTIITGPRGCGKTTILRNMSLRTEIESGSIDEIDDISHFGVYYPSQDLHFAFHYMGDNPSEKEQDLLIHYVSLSLGKEFLETLVLMKERLGASVPNSAVKELEESLSEWITDYQKPPKNADILEHLVSILNQEKNRVGTALRHRPQGLEEPENTIPVDFLAPEFRNLINNTRWGTDLPIFFLIDDYSLPKISEPMQQTMNDLVMERWDQVYFKITTESITAFHALNTSGKTLEESREFEVVDLSTHFIGNSKKRIEFLTEVINTRLRNTKGLPEKYNNLQDILGENPYNSYNELARQIRSNKKVTYSGHSTMGDIFSGDLSEILRIIRGIFESAGSDEEWNNGDISIPISGEIQDERIREYGASFLNKIESVPETGPQLKEIAQSFGNECNRLLLNEDSSNQGDNPPKQAFRIELRDSFSFEQGEIFAEVAAKVRKTSNENIDQEELVERSESVYNDLLRYGVFLLDVRGKSVRGKVVNRLYLRRLLLPKFNLTPSQRDNVSMEPSEFLHLLVNPEEYPTPNSRRPQDESLYDWETIDQSGDQNGDKK